MKKAAIFARIIICALVMLCALGFAAIEGWQLVSGDWRLFENDGLALGQIIARSLLLLYAFIMGLCGAIRRKKSFLWEGLLLFGAAISSVPFISNHLGWIFVLFAALFLASDPGILNFLKGRHRKM